MIQLLLSQRQARTEVDIQEQKVLWQTQDRKRQVNNNIVKDDTTSYILRIDNFGDQNIIEKTVFEAARITENI